MDLKESRTLKQLFKYVDEHENDFIEVLSEAVRIPSVSLDPQLRESCIDMVNWMSCKMKSLGIEIEECNIGRQTISDWTTPRFPPIILGTLGNNPDLPTVCIYGHLDVYPAKHEDGWATNPFTVTEIEGKLYGRGTCDNKGSLLCWLNAVKAYQGASLTLPVNLRFVFECMEESASEGLLPLLRERKGSFFKHISSVCISDNYWLGRNKPCLTYGVRGRCSFRVDVQAGNKDLDSGSNGGIMNEPMADLIYLLDTLIDRKGKILIPNIYRDVTPVSEEEIIRYKTIDFKVTEYKKNLGVQEVLHDEDKLNILMHRWRFPSLSIHRIESGFNPSSTTIIPYKVTGSFSIYLVPDQNPETIKKQVVDHLSNAWMKRGSRNKFNVVMTEGMKAWAVDPMSRNFEAAKRAVKRVNNISPDLTREGSTKPLVLMFQEVSNNVILIPIGTSDDSVHSPNEKINTANYTNGIKVCGAYLYEISQAHASGLKGFTEFDFTNIQSDL